MGRFIKMFGMAALLFVVNSLAVHSGEIKKVYVLSLKTKVFTSAAFDSRVMGTASRGRELSLIDAKERWFKVEFDGGVGWVPALVVGDKAPMEKIAALNGSAKELKQDARKRASATTTSGATRGLVSETRSRVGRDLGSDFRSLEELEAKTVSEDEVWTFLNEMDAAR